MTFLIRDLRFAILLFTVHCLLITSANAALTIRTDPATNVTASMAYMNATITDTGSAPAYVVFYWGTSDGGTNPAGWSFAQMPSTNAYGTGTVSTVLYALDDATTYHYRAYAWTTSETAWATASTNFSTPSANPTSIVPASAWYIERNSNYVIRDMELLADANGIATTGTIENLGLDPSNFLSKTGGILSGGLTNTHPIRSYSEVSVRLYDHVYGGLYSHDDLISLVSIFGDASANKIDLTLDDGIYLKGYSPFLYYDPIGGYAAYTNGDTAPFNLIPCKTISDAWYLSKRTNVPAYLITNAIATLTGNGTLATGTPVYVENDPLWNEKSNTVFYSSGGVITGPSTTASLRVDGELTMGADLYLGPQQAGVSRTLRFPDGSHTGTMQMAAGFLGIYGYQGITLLSPTHVNSHFTCDSMDGITITNLVELDPQFHAWLGTNGYVKTETDPDFAAEESNVVKKTSAEIHSTLNAYGDIYIGPNTPPGTSKSILFDTGSVTGAIRCQNGQLVIRVDEGVFVFSNLVVYGHIEAMSINGSTTTNLNLGSLNLANSYTGGTMRLATTNGTTFFLEP
jgi:hypothetical protein